jgi:hypothetical protein
MFIYFFPHYKILGLEPEFSGLKFELSGKSQHTATSFKNLMRIFHILQTRELAIFPEIHRNIQNFKIKIQDFFDIFSRNF